MRLIKHEHINKETKSKHIINKKMFKINMFDKIGKIKRHIWIDKTGSNLKIRRNVINKV